MSTTAKLFKNGESQAIRLPKEFRITGKEVRLTRLGHGILVEPIEEDFSSLVEALNEFSSDFMEDGRQQPVQQKREDVFE